MDTKFETRPTIEQQFFKESNQTPEAVKMVIAAFKKQHALSGLANTLAKQEGYPAWDKSQVQVKKGLPIYNFNGEAETQEIYVFTPILQQDSSMLSGFYMSKIVGDSVELHLYRANDYDQFPYGKTDSSVVTAELITMKLLELNDTVFGHRKYELADRNLFQQNMTAYDFRTIETNQSQTVAKKVVSCDFTCYYLQTNACISTTNWCTFCQLVTCVTNCPTIGTGGGGTSGGGGASGGGFNWPPNPTTGTGGGGTGGGGSTPPNTGNCTGVYTCRPGTLIEAGRIPCGSCGPGPIVVLPPDEETIPTFYDIAPPPFSWVFPGDDGTSFTDANPSIEPDFILEQSDNYESLYPKFTNMVKNLKLFVKSNPRVLNALQTWSGFSKQEIINHLTYGQGPIIKIENMRGRFGHFDKKSPNVLHISKEYVQLLELSFTERFKDGVSFLLAITILHEYIHLGTTHNNISEGKFDFGQGFEKDAFNVIVEDVNAIETVVKFSKYS